MTVSASDYTALITQQHRKSPKFMAMVGAWCGAAATVNNVSAAIIPATDPATALGRQQDIIAEWVGLTRSIPVPIEGFFFTWDDDTNPTKTGWDYGHWRGVGDPATGIQELNDSLFRPVLQAKILANQWEGDIDGAYAIVRAALGAGVGIKIVENNADSEAEIAATADNTLTITENPSPESYYAGTIGNDLNVTETVDTDAYIASTVGNDLEVTQLVLGNTATIQKTPANWSSGDVGKTIKIINTAGTVLCTVLINKFYDLSNEIEGTVITGTLTLGQTITGGLWGFSTEDVITPGDYTLTADSAKFASGDVTKTVRQIDTDGSTLADFEVTRYLSSTVVEGNLTDGTAPESEVDGGKWDFSTAAILTKDDYLLECAVDYFAVGNIGDTVIIIDAFGDPVCEIELTGYADEQNVSGNLTAGTIPAGGTAAAKTWGLDSETITRPASVDMKMTVQITGATALQQALFTQKILPIKPAGVTIEYIFID